MTKFLEDNLCYLSDIKNAKVLDCGCGEGNNTIFLLKRGAEVTAFDIDNDALEICRSRINDGDYSEKAHILQSDVVSMDFSETKLFDIVVCTNVLHFLSDDEAKKALMNIVNRLSHNGILIFSYILDKKGISSELTDILFSETIPLKLQCKKIHDNGHNGMPEPHDHIIFQYIGKKK